VLAGLVREQGDLSYCPMDSAGVTGVERHLSDELNMIAYQLDGIYNP
jgi:hypothetical protein